MFVCVFYPVLCWRVWFEPHPRPSSSSWPTSSPSIFSCSSFSWPSCISNCFTSLQFSMALLNSTRSPELVLLVSVHVLVDVFIRLSRTNFRFLCSSFYTSDSFIFLSLYIMPWLFYINLNFFVIYSRKSWEIVPWKQVKLKRRSLVGWTDGFCVYDIRTSQTSFEGLSD